VAKENIYCNKLVYCLYCHTTSNWLGDKNIHCQAEKKFLFRFKYANAYDWIIFAVIIMHVICLATVLQSLIDGLCSFSFLNQPCRKEDIMAILTKPNFIRLKL